MKIMLLLLALLCVPLACAADDSSIVYSVATIKIVPKPGTFKPQPASQALPGAAAQTSPGAKKADTDTGSEKNRAIVKPIPATPPAPVPRDTKEFLVEVRPLGILQQKEFIVHEPFSDSRGMLILVDPPQPVPLKAAPLLGKADALLVTGDGMIAKIAPDLSLNTLDEPIQADSPVRAFVFLQAGSAQQQDIQPGDRVEGGLFKTHPIVLESPTSATVIDNTPPPDTQHPVAEQQAAHGKKHMPHPKSTPDIVYPVSSAPPAENQQLIDQLQK